MLPLFLRIILKKVNSFLIHQQVKVSLLILIRYDLKKNQNHKTLILLQARCVHHFLSCQNHWRAVEFPSNCGVLVPIPAAYGTSQKKKYLPSVLLTRMVTVSLKEDLFSQTTQEEERSLVSFSPAQCATIVMPFLKSIHVTLKTT